MMRRAVLIVAPFLPWPPDFGGALRIFHLMRELAIDHEVLLCAPATNDEWPAIAALGAFCDVTAVPASWTPRHPAGWSKRTHQVRALAAGRSLHAQSDDRGQMQAAINRLFLTRRIDLVQFEFSQMGVFTTPRPCPTVIDVHNIEHALLRRIASTTLSSQKATYNAIEYRRLMALEHRVWRNASLCVATSAADAATIESFTHSPAAVVPNGVDAAFFAAVEPDPATPRIIFTGTMRHAPNADGALWYLDHAHALVRERVPNVELAIVGSDPPVTLLVHRSPAIEVTGRVDDIRPWFANASVAIVPLLSGSGTRLKILEAIAAGVPVVSTSIGAEGLELEPDSDILLADAPNEFASAITRVLTDGYVALRLSQRGRSIAATRFDWSVVSRSLIDAHDRAIERFEAAT